MEQEYSPERLKEKYACIIEEYLPQANDEVWKHLVYNNNINEIRFWNCVSVQNAKNGILWVSINPSGEPGEKSLVGDFNMGWDKLDKENRYWKRMLDNIHLVEDCCGHMDLLPIHWADEDKLKRVLFTKSDCRERELAYNLLQESKKLIEALHPKLIIYSNATTAWLWGNGESDFWLGYDPQEENISAEEWKSLGVKHGRLLSGKPSLYKINLKHRVTTYLLLDYQVANTFGYDALTGDDVKIIWDYLSK